MTIQDITTLFKLEAAKHGFGDLPIKTDTSRRRIAGMGHIGPVPMYFTFSTVLMPLMSEAEVLDTIRHEIAHAKTPDAGHGPMWKLAAIAIGARPEPCSGAKIDAKMAGYKYIAACACGPHTHGKTRRPTRSVMCSTCRQHLDYVQQY